jgi:fucose permease
MRGSRWGGWAVAAFFYLFDVFLRLTVDVCTSKLQAEFGLSAAAVSGAFSSSFFYGYAAMQLPIGILLDRLGPRATIALASLVSGAGCLLFSCAHSTAVGAVARVISGVGCGCGWLGAVKVTRHSFGVADTLLVRAVFATTCMLGGVGGLVSQAPFQALVDGLGWRGAYRVAACIPVGLAVGALLFVGDEPFDTHRAGGRGTSDDADDADDDKEHPLLLGDAMMPAAAAAAADDGNDNDSATRSSASSPPSSCDVLRRCLGTPRLWLYAMYLGGSDAPFETFAGLWGVAFLHQVYGWSKTTAAAATTVVVITSTVSQLAAGGVMGYLRSLRSQLHALTALAVVGLASFAPFLLAPVVAGITTVDWLGWAACVALGLATASCTIVWSVISSDPLCDGSASTGVISGAVNTLCIAYDAAIQQCTGAVLAAMWAGGKDPDGEPVYGPQAFSWAFVVLASSFFLAALSSAAAAACRHAETEKAGR